VKHNYVIQANFDLNEWPECKDARDENTKNLFWTMKIISSDTIAIVKDTDKEDAEKNLKESWERLDPGRNDKGKKSRIKFILSKRLRSGDLLTGMLIFLFLEEEMDILKEEKPKGSKKEEIQETKKGSKVQPKSKEEKKAKGNAPDLSQLEEEELPKRDLPEPKNHVNLQLRGFLEHFHSERLIHIPCKKLNARQREHSEKLLLKTERMREVEKIKMRILENKENRDLNTERQRESKSHFVSVLDEKRSLFKTMRNDIMDERNKYRDMISQRKEKERNLIELMEMDKVDF
jgi:hypothetical protein